MWNPRSELYEKHFIELVNGQLLALTVTGEFTCQQLRLNRPPLIAHRLQRRRQAEKTRIIEEYQDVVLSLTQLNSQLTNLVAEQQGVLKEQRDIIRFLLQN